jgi:hypothetical protein
MSLESTPSEAFLGNDASEDDFASLDSMGFTSGSHSQQFGMNTVLMPPSGGGGGSDYVMSTNSSTSNIGGGVATTTANDEREGGISGGALSGSLFDRIRARTAEQQKLSNSNHSTHATVAPSNQVAAQQQQRRQQQQLQYPQSSESAFMSNQQQQQPSISGEPSHQNTILANNNETTYSFTSSGAGEDFSQLNSNTTANANMPHIPVYGASRDDPYYIAANNNANHQHQFHSTNNFQDKATMALVQTGETMKSLWNVGVNGAQTIGAMAKDRMMGSGNNDERGGYNNNFLLRDEDNLEEGGGGSATMSQPPPQFHTGTTTTTTTSGGATADQAYSMLQYGKTFCEDIIGFVRQLPSWGQGIVGVIMLWLLYALFG